MAESQFADWLAQRPRVRPPHWGPLTITVGFQQVGSEPLRSLPLLSVMTVPLGIFLDKHGDRIDHFVHDLLLYHGYPVSEDFADARDETDSAEVCWKICSQYEPEKDSQSYITVLITAPWHSENVQKWRRACETLKTWLDEVLKDTGHNVLVEMGIWAPIRCPSLRSSRFGP
ncbi:hypothetical protein LEL_05777 [Akanthomyces lecanii RCEF 1005]|uniref:Uncharacterized protein n=1 Tax=Akanthomyces lecanii RCEF 1005 TaxID=1081108 RepID=A0A168G6C9_CORDF|nr:hypothetical protein LEL_05777 [Akanthomyces lecanii RCEF 1005]